LPNLKHERIEKNLNGLLIGLAHGLDFEQHNRHRLVRFRYPETEVAVKRVYLPAVGKDQETLGFVA
jgi:hypothetical protein